MFTSDIYAAAGMHESFPSFPQVEEDDRLPFQFVDFDTRYGDLAAVQSDYESIAHGYHENAWPAPHHINEGVRPSHLYAPPTDQYRGRTQSIATEDTSAAQGPTAAISPESAQSYNDVDLLDDADGDMDMEFAQLQTSDRQSFSQAETLCQSIAQTPQQPTPTRSNKTPRKSRRNGNSATSSSPLIFTPTTSAKSANSSKPTESKPNKKSRSRKGADGDAAQYICTWTGCGQACRIMSDYK